MAEDPTLVAGSLGEDSVDGASALPDEQVVELDEQVLGNRLAGLVGLRDYDELQEQLRARVLQPDHTLPNGEPLLFWAASNGSCELVSLLLDSRASIDQRTLIGASALYAAAAGGRRPLVELLLLRGASANLATNSSATPLHAAATHPEILRLLLLYGASINHTNRVGVSALHLAAMRGSAASVRALLLMGADATLQTGRSKTAADYAESSKNAEVVALLQPAAIDELRANNRWRFSLFVLTPPAFQAVVRTLVYIHRLDHDSILSVLPRELLWLILAELDWMSWTAEELASSTSTSALSLSSSTSSRAHRRRQRVFQCVLS